MASTSRTVATKSILTPSMTLKGHGEGIGSISYFPDGQRMISGSLDKTARQWDLKSGKEIEEARDVCEGYVLAVAVSRNSRWIVTGGGNRCVELKVCEVETGIVKVLQDHSLSVINHIDISLDNTLLASMSLDWTVRIWNLETGKLVAGPLELESILMMGAVRFSTDSKKLAITSDVGKFLEVWDVRLQKLYESIGGSRGGAVVRVPVFWTNNNKSILAAFSFTEDDDAKTIYEFDASTLDTVGTPFEGHTKRVSGLALSFDGALLAGCSWDDTIKLWAFESRQLLASFDVQNPRALILSPDSRKLAYTTYTDAPPPTLADATTTKYEAKICIYDTPPDVLAQARSIARKQRALSNLPNSDATCRSAPGRRRPPIHAIPMVQRPPPTIDPRQPIFVRLSNLLRFSPRTNPAHSVRNDQPRDPLDFSATSPLSRPVSGHTSTQGRSHINSSENSRSLSTTRSPATPPTTFAARIHHLSSWWPVRGGHAQPNIIDVPLAQAKERNAAAGAPQKDEDIVPDEYLDPPSPNPDSQQRAAAVPATGEHGGDRSCFCF